MFVLEINKIHFVFFFSPKLASFSNSAQQYGELPAKYRHNPDQHGQNVQGISHGENKSYIWDNFPLLTVTQETR